MGRRGPAPKPTALRVLGGNAGRRPLNHDEPKPELADATAPELTEAALAVWQEVAPQLVALGLVSRIDRAHLARACRLEAVGRDALAKVEATETGPVSISPANGETVSAHFAAAIKAFDSADKIWFRFGLTPAERTKLKVAPPKQEDPFDAYKRRKKPEADA